MAVNQLSSLLDMDIPVPKRSNFYRGYINRFSASLGYVYPAGVWEILPNTRCRMDISVLLKSEPLVSSLFGTMRQSIQAFFVPSRLYVKELDQNFRNGIRNEDLEYVKFPVLGQFARSDENPSSAKVGFGSSMYSSGELRYDSTVPQSDIDEKLGYIEPGSLFDMLGMFPSNFDLGRTLYGPEDDVVTNYSPCVNAIPFIGYYDIFRNYYVNMQDNYIPFVSSEDVDSVTYITRDISFFDYMISSVYDRVNDLESWDNSVDENTEGWNILHNSIIRNFVSSMISSSYYPGTESGVNRRVHTGYFPRVFDDDYFMSRLDSNYVSQLDSTSRILVQNDQINVAQLRLANRNYRYTSKNMLANSQRYDDWLSVHYGAKLNRALNIPQFLGSISKEFGFDDVYATAVSLNLDGENVTNGSLGDRGSVLNDSLQGRRFVDFETEEHGYLIVLYSILPRIDYSGFLNKFYLKDTMADVYKPEYDAVGYQNLVNFELGNADASSYNQIVGKQVSWFEYMTDFNRVHGRFTQPERDFTVLTYGKPQILGSTRLNTYIVPSSFVNIFEDVTSWQDNFYVQMNMELTCYQPMSKQIISYT